MAKEDASDDGQQTACHTIIDGGTKSASAIKRMSDGDGANPSIVMETSGEQNSAAAMTSSLPSSDATATRMIPVPPSTAVSTVAFEGYLLQTLLDLQRRSQVEATLNDLVTDVEFAVNLQDRLSLQTHQSQAERIIAEQALALEETHVVQKDRLESQTLLGDALVKDLWSLSKEVGGLLELKQKHEAMILDYDELMAKLAQAEEDLYAAKTSPPPQQQQSQQQQTAPQPAAAQPTPPPAQQPTATVVNIPDKPTPRIISSTATVVKIPDKPVPPISSTATVVNIPDKPTPPISSTATVVNIPDKPVPLPITSTADSDTKTETLSEKPAAALKTDPEEGDTEAVQEETPTEPVPSTAGNEAVATTTKAPVVALVQEDDQDADGDETRVTMENIDMEILMRIFGFLDAYDILNTAQVNISMYSRVDSLFGFGMDAAPGGGGVVHDDNVSTSSTLATTPTVAAATATTASVSTATTAVKSAPAPSSSTAKAAAVAKQVEHNNQFGHRLVGGGRNIFNLLQGGVAGAKTDGAAGGDTSKRAQSPKGRGGAGGRGRSGSTDANDGKPPLSEAMAHSMAAKLNDAEINAIISMTEKLRSKEKQVSLMIKEKEDLEGKLNGSDAVKDFLITKVRDMEKIMNTSDETEKKVTQQIASDQEVIAFLDGRVQELERQTRVIQKEKSGTQDKLKSVVAQNDKKVAVLSDMLQFERQKLKENEREWKATKKLLVKEVKGCRAQIIALQAERDGFREQNDALRKAVMASGSTPNGRASSPHR